MFLVWELNWGFIWEFKWEFKYEPKWYDIKCFQLYDEMYIIEANRGVLREMIM